MILLEQARKLLQQNISLLDTITLSVLNAEGYALATDIHSEIDMPPFRQSSIDGYAIRQQDTEAYTIVGEIQAGSASNPSLLQGEAVRIFTGAAMPSDADGLIMQEHVKKIANQIFIQQDKVNADLIREKGEQIKKGKLAMAKGTVLSPAAIGFLQTLGVDKVKVRRKPSIAIVITGNELQKAGNPLEYGQIYESNAAMLSTALQKNGFAVNKVVYLLDEYQATKAQLSILSDRHDVVIITGGISVGEYDFVGKALTDLGTKEVFYKVKQKPGKPLYFGKRGFCHVFALPGNPAAVLTCYYQHVLPCLQQAMGAASFGLSKIRLPIAEDYNKKGERAHFLKAKLMGDKVTRLGAQSSAMLSSFAIADCFIFIPATQMETRAGDLVEVHLIPS